MFNGDDYFINQTGSQSVSGWGTPYKDGDRVYMEIEDYESGWEGSEWNDDYSCSDCGAESYRLEELVEEVSYNYVIVDADLEFDTWQELQAELEKWDADYYVEIYDAEDNHVWDGDVGELPNEPPGKPKVPAGTEVKLDPIYMGANATASTSGNIITVSKLVVPPQSTTPLADEVLKTIKPVD